MPRVSIGVPVYNGERYIADSLRSLLKQTYTDFEIIISDNASTDQTERICREFAAADPRVRYYRNARNLGAAANYNRAFALSTGIYFKWAAHDDVCAPEFLERCVQVLDKHPSAALCHPRASIIDEQGNRLYDDDARFHLVAPLPAQRLREYFLAGSWIFHPIFGVIRRSVLENTPLIGAYDGADFVLLAYLALAGECIEIPDRLFFRREHENRCCKVPREKMPQWWSTDNRARIYLRHWRRVFEYLRAIRKQPKMSPADRWRCFWEIVKWSYWHRQHLYGDVRDAVKTANRRHLYSAR